MKNLQDKRNAVEQKLVSLEKQIWALEGTYLSETAHLGNILRGWGDYLSARSGALKRVPRPVKEEDRLFSLSSATSLKAQETPSTKK